MCLNNSTTYESEPHSRHCLCFLFLFHMYFFSGIVIFLGGDLGGWNWAWGFLGK
jgi:hypothetical protein